MYHGEQSQLVATHIQLSSYQLVFTKSEDGHYATLALTIGVSELVGKSVANQDWFAQSDKRVLMVVDRRTGSVVYHPKPGTFSMPLWKVAPEIAHSDLVEMAARPEGSMVTKGTKVEWVAAAEDFILIQTTRLDLVEFGANHPFLAKAFFVRISGG